MYYTNGYVLTCRINRIQMSLGSKLKKLSEDSLTKQPEEVFDVLEKLGEG